MESKHTPGPWKVTSQRQDMRSTRVVEYKVLHGDRLGKATYERKANADLIAAAPEIYGALLASVSVLESILDSIRSDGAIDAYIVEGAYVDATRALAKAEGR